MHTKRRHTRRPSGRHEGNSKERDVHANDVKNREKQFAHYGGGFPLSGKIGKKKGG